VKKGPKSYVEQSRARLLDLWTGELSFGAPLGCVATTFTFDAAFYEEHCLGRFIGMQSNAKETAKAYLIEREEKLSQCFACVLVDHTQVEIDRSLRWNQIPIALHGGGAQHAKVTILMWEHRIRVLVGSANLTEPGYRLNQEHLAVLEFGAEGDCDGEMLLQLVSFLEEVREFSPGTTRTDEGPHASLTYFLSSLRSRAAGCQVTQPSDANIFLVPLVPGTSAGSVLKQLQERWKPPAPDLAFVVSPFYDEGVRAGEVAKELGKILSTRGERTICFTAPGRKLHDGTEQIDLPEELIATSHPSLCHEFHYVEDCIDVSGSMTRRPLHAKSIWLEKAQRAMFLIA